MLAVVGFVMIGMLAAFGALCAAWMLFGFLLPGAKGGVLVCLCKGREEAVIRRYLWLHGAGLLTCPLVLLDSRLPQQQQAKIAEKYPNIKFYALESFLSGLTEEAERLG